MKTPWPYPGLVAHRGGGILAPENTLAGIRFGHGLGYRVAEIDIRFTKDGIAVLQHDAQLDRTTSGHGPLAERTWAELAPLDAGSWHSEAFRGEPMARFDEAARLFRAIPMFAHVEIKRTPGRHREAGDGVARSAAALWKGAEERPLLISFSLEALAAAREAEPTLARGWIVEEPWNGDLAPLADIAPVSVHAEHVLVTPELVARTHDAGYRLLAWTVNDAARGRELLALGVDGLVTDNLREFAAQFPGLL